jgi:galactose-1-phosphate uridylyltransferase
MKTKVGTVLETEVVKQLRQFSAKENKSISEIIEEALKKYFTIGANPREQRLQAVEKLCSAPFNVNKDELDEIMSEDYYGL